MNDIYVQFAVYHIMHDRAIYNWPIIPGTPSFNGILTDSLDSSISDLQFRQVWDAVNRPLQNATPGHTLINHCAYIIHTNG
jgi:hypothetical protein